VLLLAGGTGASLNVWHVLHSASQPASRWAGLIDAGPAILAAPVRVAAAFEPLLAPWGPLNRNRGDVGWRSVRLAGSKFRVVPQRLGATVSIRLRRSGPARATGLPGPGAAGLRGPGPPPPRQRPRPAATASAPQRCVAGRRIRAESVPQRRPAQTSRGAQSLGCSQAVARPS